MAIEWNWPVQIPRFTTAKYEKKKAEHVEEYGYRVHIPRFDDIIHLGTPKKATEAELKAYFLRDYQTLGGERYKEIHDSFLKRKERIERMMDSPAPIWYQNLASAMTFIDDLEDALSTVAMIGRIAARFAPRLFGKLFRGPIGWIMLINDLLNISQLITCLPMGAFSKKRVMEDLVLHNPFSKKARLKRARRFRRWWPSFGDILETLQTTDNIFGIGLSLGPLVGFMADSFFGTYRMIRGDKVRWGSEPPELYPHELIAMRAFRALPIMFLGGDAISDDDKFMAIITANLSLQVIREYSQEWNLLDHLENIDDIELIPPTPTNPLTRLALEDAGVNPDTQIGFPTFSPQEYTFKNLSTQYMVRASNDFVKYADDNQHNMKGWVAANNATEYAEGILALFEGSDQLEATLKSPPQNILNAMQGKYDREKSMKELQALKEAQDIELESIEDFEEYWNEYQRRKAAEETQKEEDERMEQIRRLMNQLQYFLENWRGDYMGSIPNWPPGGMVKGPIEWVYLDNYHEIWNPPQSWRSKPKYSSYDKISWQLEHDATPWYVKYCLWGMVLGDFEGGVTTYWARARAIAEAKIPYSFNPMANIKGRGEIRFPAYATIFLYCRQECNLDILPDFMLEFLQKITAGKY